jgi:hypothetical protein
MSECRPLIEVLSEVPDFRQAQGKRHPLPAILALACAATLCGYRSYGAMAQWGKNYGRDLAHALGFPGGRTPAIGTLHTVLSGLDRMALERTLSGWAECVLAHLPRETDTRETDTQRAAPLQAIALDGKTLRGSKARGACDAHLLSAVSHGLGLTLFQEAVGDKTSEITAAQAVLSSLLLEGRVVTMDALLTQKAIARAVVSKGGTSS